MKISYTSTVLLQQNGRQHSTNGQEGRRINDRYRLGRHTLHNNTAQFVKDCHYFQSFKHMNVFIGHSCYAALLQLLKLTL